MHFLSAKNFDRTIFDTTVNFYSTQNIPMQNKVEIGEIVERYDR